MSIDQLPEDQFNVIVNNDMDRACLLWLVNRIGEAKLRKSVAKDLAHWPDSKPFVSTLLKRYHLKVPVCIYAPVNIPVYWLYLLHKRDGSEVKIGMTGDWPWRAYAEVPLRKKLSDIYDLERSRAYLVGGKKTEVLRRETAIKRKFVPWRSRPKYGWNNGYTEWFNGNMFEDIVEMASSFDSQKDLVVQTLGQAIVLHTQQHIQPPHNND